MPDETMRDLILLFRGVNVGGHRKLPMAALRDGLTQAGFHTPRSYIQSGNVVVGSRLARAQVVGSVQEVVSGMFGFVPDLMVLDREEMASALDACPFATPDADPSRVHLFFHIEEPVALDGLQAEPGDRARLACGNLAHYLDTPDGMSQSKLAERMSRRLKDKATARNLRTCRKLLELAT